MIYQKQGGLTLKTAIHLGETFSRGNCIIDQFGNKKKPIKSINTYEIECGDFILHIVRCACRFRVSLYHVVGTSSRNAEVVEIPNNRLNEYPEIELTVQELKDKLCQIPEKIIS